MAFAVVVEFEDEEELSPYEGGDTLESARRTLCEIVRAATKSKRNVHDADIYHDGGHLMNVPVAFLVASNQWESWCGNPS